MKEGAKASFFVLIRQGQLTIFVSRPSN